MPFRAERLSLSGEEHEELRRMSVSRMVRKSKRQLGSKSDRKEDLDKRLTSPHLQFFGFENVVAKIHNHGVKAKLEPALECL